MWQDMVLPNIFENIYEPVSNEEIQRRKYPKSNFVAAPYEYDPGKPTQKHRSQYNPLPVSRILCQIDYSTIKHHRTDNYADEFQQADFVFLVYCQHIGIPISGMYNNICYF